MHTSPNFKAGDFFYFFIPGEAGEEETPRIKAGKGWLLFVFIFKQNLTVIAVKVTA